MANKLKKLKRRIKACEQSIELLVSENTRLMQDHGVIQETIEKMAEVINGLDFDLKTVQSEVARLNDWKRAQEDSQFQRLIEEEREIEAETRQATLGEPPAGWSFSGPQVS